MTQSASAAPPPMRSASLFWLSWSVTLVPMSPVVAERVTIRPVATDSSSAGICETRPSPTLSRLYWFIASAGDRPCWRMPTAKPPTRLIIGDDDGRDGVALDELGAAVHRAVEVGLGGDVGAALAGLGLVDQAGVEVGVDRHLLAGHGVEGEPGADLGDPLGALGDHDELDDDQDQEDHQADDQVAADHEAAERVDHLAGVAVAQHQPGGADVEREPEQGGDQQQRREDREVERPLDEHADQQDQQGRR